MRQFRLLSHQKKKHLTSSGWLDTVGWVIWPAKTVPEMTYNVFSGTLNPTHSLEIGLLIDTNGTRNSKNPSLHQEVARCRFIHMYVFFVMQSSRSVRKVISDAEDEFSLRWLFIASVQTSSTKFDKFVVEKHAPMCDASTQPTARLYNQLSVCSVCFHLSWNMQRSVIRRAPICTGHNDAGLQCVMCKAIVSTSRRT